MKRTKFSRLKLVIAAFGLVAANFAFLSSVSSAATLTNTYVELNRMKAGSTTSVRVVFKTTANAGATGLTVDFNGTDTGGGAWTGATGSVNATQTIAGTAGCDVSATALPGTLAASGATSVVTVTGVTALAANTTYCFDLTSASAVTNPTAGEYHPVITETGGATDSTNVAVRVVSNDQVVVSATVPPSFNFAITANGGSCSGNSDGFTTNLSTASVATTGGCKVTVNTNASNGWLAWAQDNNTGLHSAAASKTIASSGVGAASTTCTVNTECYRFGVTSISQVGGSATPTANANYDATGANQGSGLDGTLRLFATNTGTSDTATLIVKERASINATTPAATDYTDTITLIGSGNF